jgi:hypothetical protein
MTCARQSTGAWRSEQSGCWKKTVAARATGFASQNNPKLPGTGKKDNNHGQEEQNGSGNCDQYQ